jgi:hypothetical protein
MTTEKPKPPYNVQVTRSRKQVIVNKVPRRRSPDPAQKHSDDQTKTPQNALHRPVPEHTIPTTPEVPDGVAPQPTPESVQPVENGGNTSPASEVVATTMLGSGEPIPGFPVPLAAATSGLPSTTDETQNGTTAEVLDENATARADASTVTPRDRIDDRLLEIAKLYGIERRLCKIEENLYGIEDHLREITEKLWDVEATVHEQSELVEEWTRPIRKKVGRKRNPKS